MNAAEEYLHLRGLKRESWEAYGVEIYDIKIKAPFWERLKPGKAKATLIANHSQESLWIPSRGLNGTEETLWQVRIFSTLPDLDRFHIPQGQRSPVWISPQAVSAAKDVAQPVYVTEGLIKAMTLAQAGVSSIGLVGVWGVAEPNGEKKKVLKSLDERDEEKANPKPKAKPKLCHIRKELAEFSWRSRRVYLCFDADQAGNTQVRQAAIRSLFLFSIQGAEVFQMEWPLSEGKGIDDYLRKHGQDEDGNNLPERQAEALARLTGTARAFLECLGPHDVDLFSKELFKVAMSDARREQFASLARKALGATKATLLASNGHHKDSIDEVLEVPPTAEPWSSAVTATEVLDSICDEMNRFVSLQPYQAQAGALWIVQEYLAKDISILPLLLITSPEEECGKTTLMEFVYNLSNRPIPASNISAAAVYRIIKDICPTLLLDEADTYIQENEALRGVINSGHKRRMAHVARVIDDKNNVGLLSTWCPKAIAMIGFPKPTILSRSIHIRLQRKSGEEKKEFLADRHYQEFETLRRKISRLANDIRDKVRRSSIRDENLLGNRAGDNWRSMFAIAREASQEWLEKAMQAADRMQRAAGKDALSFSQALIIGLGELFEQTRERRGLDVEENFLVKTDDILGSKGLNNDKEAPWSDLPSGLTAQRLAKELRAYEVESHLQRLGENQGKAARGYWSKDIEKVVTQYRRKWKKTA